MGNLYIRTTAPRSTIEHCISHKRFTIQSDSTSTPRLYIIDHPACRSEFITKSHTSRDSCHASHRLVRTITSISPLPLSLQLCVIANVVDSHRVATRVTYANPRITTFATTAKSISRPMPGYKVTGAKVPITTIVSTAMTTSIAMEIISCTKERNITIARSVIECSGVAERLGYRSTTGSRMLTSTAFLVNECLILRIISAR